MGPAPSVGAGFSPLDAELGLVGQQRYSPRVEETLVQLAAETTFGKAVRLLQRCTGVQTSASTARRRTYAAGAAALAVEAAEQAQLVADPPPVERTGICMQVSIDATKVQLVGGLWTDVKLSSMAQVVLRPDKAGKPVVRAIHLTYAARWEPAEQFGQTLTLEAERRNLAGATRVLSPNDGAVWIQDLVDLIAPQAVRILDEPHAAEHLTLVSQLVYGPTSLLATDWVARQRTTLLEDLDGPARLLADLDRCLAGGPHPAAPRTAEDPDPAAALAREVAYFHKRADQIAYAAFRQAGYPIGSGCVESGHNVIIAPRCKRAGMRWAGAHLNPLLVLRTIDANGRWEATWPAIWLHLQTTDRQAHRAHQQERRTLRLLRAQESAPAEQEAALPAQPNPDPAAAPVPVNPVPVAAAAPTRPAKRPPQARGQGSRPRRPAATHPWRQPLHLARQQQAS